MRHRLASPWTWLVVTVVAGVIAWGVAIIKISHTEAKTAKTEAIHEAFVRSSADGEYQRCLDQIPERQAINRLGGRLQVPSWRDCQRRKQAILETLR